MSSVTIKQIAPDPTQNLMGLENFGLSVFPGCSTGFEIPWINGKPNIGLEGKNDKELKDKFEKFWGVKFDSAEGKTFLANYEISLRHDIESFAPENNTKDEWDLHILRVNKGMGLVAVDEESFEKIAVNTFKFRITDENRELEQKVTKKQTTVKALSKLGELFDSNTNRLVLLAKYLYPAGSGIAKKTLAFSKLEELITQNISNAEKFIEASKLEPEYINTVVKVKDAMFRGIIRVGQDGRYMLSMTGTVLGRNEEEVIQYCLNPANSDIVGIGSKDDKPYSLASQLSEK